MHSYLPMHAKHDYSLEPLAAELLPGRCSAEHVYSLKHQQCHLCHPAWCTLRTQQSSCVARQSQFTARIRPPFKAEAVP